MFIFFLPFAVWGKEPTKFAIIVASYNNSDFCHEHLESVLNQDYENYHVYYVDDGSTDSTLECVRSYVCKHQKQDRITIITNCTRNGSHVENQYNVICHCLTDDTVVVIVDGDDTLNGPNVLQYLDQIYSNSDVWMTYGQFREKHSGTLGYCAPYSEEVIANNAFREVMGNEPTHLRTFYAWLFKKVRTEDLKYEGRFYTITGGLAMTFPMIEMAGRHHCYIDDVLYIYNDENPISDWRTQQELQDEVDLYIRALPRYEPL